MPATPSTRRARPGAVDASADVSLTLVSGRLSRPAELRTLPSGDVLLALELTTRPPDGPTESMPVVWPDPPRWSGSLGRGEQVVVLGRVRRRFYRVAGATASRTEVVAERIVRSRQRAGVRALVVEASRRLDPGGTDGPP